jgi:uncharacterized membrane protein YqaE (UPF0057 family)
MIGPDYRPSILAIILAVLLPPLGVLIVDGFGMVLLVSVILTCLGYLPGMIFSLIAVLKPEMVSGLRGNRL